MQSPQEAIDDRLQKALDFSNYRITLYNQKQLLKLKLDEQLTYSVNGGIFKITQELISFVHSLVVEENEDVILIDVNGNPIFIENLKKFQSNILNKYYQSTNEYLREFKVMQKARNVQSLVLE